MWKVPLADMSFGPEEAAAIQRVLDSGWLTMGAVTREFEQEFSAYTGARHAIAVTNATAGLHLACLAAGLGPGDEVILHSLTFVATANAVRYAGAAPVFADIKGEDDLTISVDAIEKAITPRTKAIMVMHYAGYACEMPAILALAEKHGLAVIEDAAHAAGSELDGRHLGTWGRVGVFSFFSNKNLTTGEGGMVVTNDDRVAEQVRLLRSHGMTTLTWDRHQGHAWSYDVIGLGYNYRIDEIRSALGRVQLAKLNRNNARRKELTDLYQSLLTELAPQVAIPFMDHPGKSAYHIMPVLLPKGVDRTRFMDGMKSRGIQTSIHYPPIHQFRAYAEYRDAELPITEEVSAREVTLPLYPAMTDEMVQYVVQSIGEVLASG